LGDFLYIRCGNRQAGVIIKTRKVKEFHILIYILFLPIFLFGQSYKGQLTKDSLTNNYIYKVDCDDEVIVLGKSQIILKDKINDTLFNYLYEITLDSMLWGKDTQAEKCKSIYFLVNGKDKKTIHESGVFILQSSNYSILDNYTKCEYYSLTGELPILKYQKIESCETLISYNIRPKHLLIKFSANSKKVIRDKYEKLIVKKRKDNRLK